MNDPIILQEYYFSKLVICLLITKIICILLRGPIYRAFPRPKEE